MTLRAPRDHDARFPFAPAAAAAALAGAWIAARWAADPYANPDSHAFEALTRALLAGRGFAYEEPMLPGLTLLAYRAPVFPLLAAGPLALGGVPLVLALHGALAGVTAALVGAIAGHAAGRRAAWIAFALALAWWPTWQLAGQFLSETTYTALTVVAVWAAVSAQERGARRAALAGAAAAAAALTRSIGAGAALAIGAWLLRRPPRLWIAFAVAAVLVWAPWPVRNALRLHAFVPFTTNAAMNLYSGNSGVSPDACWRDMAAHPERGELGFERAFAAGTRELLRTDPARIARALARKAVAHVVPLTREPGTPLHRALLLIALAGLVGSADLRRALTVPGLVWLAHAAISIVTVTNTRYRSPSDWVIVLAAALAFEAVGRRHGARGVWALVALGAAGATTFALQLLRG